MRAIDQILERSGTVERCSLHVPEWDLTVFWDPVTAHDQRQVVAQNPADEHQLAVYLIVRKALDAAGERLFSIADVRALIHQVPLAPIARLAAAMTRDINAAVPPPRDADGDEPAPPTDGA